VDSLLPEQEQPKPLDTDRWLYPAGRGMQALSIAARILKRDNPTLAQQAFHGAEAAWQFIQSTPDKPQEYAQENFYTGDRHALFSGAVEHYLTRKVFAAVESGNDSCLDFALDYLDEIPIDFRMSHLRATVAISLAKLYGLEEVAPVQKEQIKTKMLGFAKDRLLSKAWSGPYGIDFDFGYDWGHNSWMLSIAMDLYFIGKALGVEDPQQPMLPYIEWVLGRNPHHGYSYVGGIGRNPEFTMSTLLLALGKKDTPPHQWSAEDDGLSWSNWQRALQLRPTIPGWVYAGPYWSKMGLFRYGFPYVDEGAFANQAESVTYDTAKLIFLAAFFAQNTPPQPPAPPPPPAPTTANEPAGCGCRLSPSKSVNRNVGWLFLLAFAGPLTAVRRRPFTPKPR